MDISMEDEAKNEIYQSKQDVYGRLCLSMNGKNELWGNSNRLRKRRTEEEEERRVFCWVLTSPLPKVIFGADVYMGNNRYTLIIAILSRPSSRS